LLLVIGVRVRVMIGVRWMSKHYSVIVTFIDPILTTLARPQDLIVFVFGNYFTIIIMISH